MEQAFDQLLLGHFERCGLRPNFDCPDQARRYDVVLGMKHFATPARAEAVRAYRRLWALPGGELHWHPPNLPVRDTGIICVSSGRAEWFGRFGMTTPLVLWGLLRGLPVDVVTDACEANAYRRAVEDADNLANQEHALRLLATVLDRRQQPGSNGDESPQRLGRVQVVTALRQGIQDLSHLPRGFGFNRHMSLEWMRRQFARLCVISDDNTATLGRNTLSDLDWLLTPGNVSRRLSPQVRDAAPDTRWLCVSFRPSALPPSGRPQVESLGAAVRDDSAYDGLAIRPNTRDSPWITQQLTLWNVATYTRLGAPPPNYDHTFLTGKEDVEFFRRLMDDERTSRLMLCDDTLQIVKCHAESRPDPTKETALVRGLLAQARHFSPTFSRILDTSDLSALAEVGRRFRASGLVDALALGTVEGWQRLLGELLRKQNMVLEQLLVPEL